MPALAIDTATEVAAIALGDRDTLLAESRISAGRSHLELLLPAVHELLNHNNLAIQDVSAIVAGTGPGTFSGLRVGISTARALAQALKVPLYGFGTLEALALGLLRSKRGSNDCLVLPVIDARRGQVFARLYRKEGESAVVPESDVLCLDPADLLKQISGFANGKVITGGNGALAYRKILQTSRQLDLLDSDDSGNQVCAVWHLRAVNIENGYDESQMLSIVPEYVREPDADKTVLLRMREPWLK